MSRRLVPWLLAVALIPLAARFGREVLGTLDVFADYHAYYRAATNLRGGADLYAEGKLLVARDDFDFWTQTDGQYVYPPALAGALLPLTALDIGKGASIWLLALVLGALAVPWLLARLLDRPVGVFSFLAVAAPVWFVTPLALGVRYGLVGRRVFVLVVAALALYLVAGFWPLRRSTADAGAAFAGGKIGRGGRGQVARLVLLGAAAVALVAFPVLGWRTGRIDDYLFKLAAPGLVGTIALPWFPIRHLATLRVACVALAAPVIAVVGATPLLLGLRFGQVDVPLLVLTNVALLAQLRGRGLLAGVALGAAAAVKPTLALYGLYYLRKRAWGTLGAAAVTGAVLGLGPFLLLGRGAFADWLAISRYFGGDRYGAYPSNQSWRGLLLRAFVGGPRHEPLLASPLLASALWLLAALAALALWWRFVSPGPQPAPRAVAEYGLTAALILFAAPLSEDIHYVALLLPLAFLADRLASAPGDARWRTLATLALLAFLLPLPALAERVGGGPVPRLIASAPYLYGLLLVSAALLLSIRVHPSLAARRGITPARQA